MTRRTLIVTGGAGFIGSAVVRHLVRHTPHRVINIDALTYAGHRENVAEVADEPRHTLVHLDITNGEAVTELFRRERPDGVLHLAAETHVDRSIDGPEAFVHSNTVGTLRLLEATRAYLAEADDDARRAFRFLQVSTDEVYGALGAEGAFDESSPYRPRSPYSASKAGADHLARAYFHTYGVPVLLTNCSNNYGPYQFPEKLIPLTTLRALAGATVPVYGDGSNVRDWLYVEDHVEALWTVFERGAPGETYLIGAGNERSNLQVVRGCLEALDRIVPGRAHTELIAFVEDRPGHDFRYAVDAGKLRRELGWRPRHAFEGGLEATVRWYAEHRDWCAAVTGGRYGLERLGTPA